MTPTARSACSSLVERKNSRALAKEIEELIFWTRQVRRILALCPLVLR